MILIRRPLSLSRFALLFFVFGVAHVQAANENLNSERELPGPTQWVEREAKERALGQWPCLSYLLGCGKIVTRPPRFADIGEELSGNITAGRKLALEGPCISCHRFKDGVQPGTVGPDLGQFGARGISNQDAFRWVYDMRTRNPNTVMPPFGTNELLSEQDLRNVVAFLQSLK